MKRPLRADILLAENLRTLLHARREDARSLALWCGRTDPWISKVLKGERGVRVQELGKIADFFGLTVAELFQHGISQLAERRNGQRRAQTDRRSGQDRRSPDRVGRLHPEMQTTFPDRRAVPRRKASAAHGEAS